MAEKRASSIGEITVDLDCSQALKGLKAITREAKQATAALEEVVEAQGKLRIDQEDNLSVLGIEEMKRTGAIRIADVDLAEATTKELVEELAKRAGVDHHRVNLTGVGKLSIFNSEEGYQCSYEGAARILVVID